MELTDTQIIHWVWVIFSLLVALVVAIIAYKYSSIDNNDDGNHDERRLG